MLCNLVIVISADDPLVMASDRKECEPMVYSSMRTNEGAAGQAVMLVEEDLPEAISMDQRSSLIGKCYSTTND